MLLLALFSIVPVVIAGDFVASFLGSKHLSAAERMPLALALGSGFVALGIFVFSLLASHYAIALTLVAIALVLLIYLRRLRINTKYFLLFSPWREWKLDRVIIFVPFIFLVGLSAIIAAATDLGFDGLINWGLKAQVAFVEGGWTSAYFTDPFKQFSHQDYPLLLPSLETWAYVFLFRVDEQSIKIIFPVFYLCLLSLFYGVLRRRYSDLFSLLFVLLLGSTPYLASLAAPSGYADVPLMINTFASIIFIQRWMRSHQSSDLVIGALLSALGVWVKREGIVYWLFNLVAIIIWLVLARNHREQNRVKSIIIFLIPAAAIIAPWYAFLAYYRVPTSDFVLSITPETWDRLPVIVASALGKFFDLGLWGALWILFFIVSIERWAFSHKIPDTYIWFSAFLPFLLLEASFLFSVWEPFTEHLDIASERLCLQEIPMMWYWIALQSSDLDRWLSRVLPSQFAENKNESSVRP